jgi:uncharacterized protein
MLPNMGMIIPEMGNYIVEDSLSSGLFNKTRQTVLALLYGHSDSSFYTKQVLDAVKCGRGTVQRELKNLTDTGIITREIQGRQVYYRANANCPIFSELKNIVRKTFGVADILRLSLVPEINKIKVAFIFGSLARSADDKRSDIDVMVVGSISFGDIINLLSPAEEKVGREINPVVYPVAEFKKKVQEDHHFVKAVLEEDKIYLVGDENELRKLAE